MVGVPGRSKACINCRQKKKGCDRQRPDCGECKRTATACLGYGNKTVWLNSTQDAETSVSTYRKSRQASPASSSDENSSAISSMAPLANSLYDSLARSAKESKYVGLYWSDYLPFSKASPISSLSSPTHGWVGKFDPHCTSEPTLRFATLAMSLTMLSQQDSNQHLKVKGAQVYTLAVREMIRALDSPQRVNKDGVLVAARLLSLYEVYYGLEEHLTPNRKRLSQMTSWEGHIKGELALFGRRGPAAFVTGASHQLFIDGRYNLIIASIAQRKRSPLSSKIWRTVPWRCQTKSIRDEVLDLLADTTGLLEDLDILRATADDSSSRVLRATLLENCVELETALASWRAKIEDKIDMYDFTAVGLPLRSPRNEKELALLHLSSMYWTICILLYTTWSFTMTWVTPAMLSSPTLDAAFIAGVPGFDLEPVPSTCSGIPKGHKNPKLNAFRIARASQLVFEPQFGLYSMEIIMFPIGIAMRYLLMVEPEDETSEERRLLLRSFLRPVKGTSVGRFLRNLATDVGNPVLKELPGIEGKIIRATQWWHYGM